MNRLITLFGLAVGCLIWASLITYPVMAATGSSRTIAQGFRVSGDSKLIVTGALVSTVPKNSQTVELATIDNTHSLAGVIDKNPLLSLSATNSEVQVVLSGLTTVLVSDINGRVESGDKITSSPIAGVGMRATTDSQIVGTAQGSLETDRSASRQITDSKGKKYTVHIGYVPMQVGVTSYHVQANNFLPPFLQKLANGIAGKPVSFVRILLSGALLIITLVGITVFVYTSARASITAIGRNPLAASAIRSGLFQTIIISLIVLGATILACYIVLTV